MGQTTVENWSLYGAMFDYWAAPERGITVANRSAWRRRNVNPP